MSQQASLFGPPPSKRQVFDLPDADIWLEPGFLSRSVAEDWFRRLQDGLSWRQEDIEMFGRVHPVPRLSCWLGDDGQAYTYSGIRHEPEPWGPAEALRQQIEACTGDRFNSALANLYRDGADTVSWHADDEPELGRCPRIASLSLGGTRRFVLRHKQTRQKLTLELTPGSLLWMGGLTQHAWEHSVPRTKRPVGPRINLTLRRVWKG